MKLWEKILLLNNNSEEILKQNDNGNIQEITGRYHKIKLPEKTSCNYRGSFERRNSGNNGIPEQSNGFLEEK